MWERRGSRDSHDEVTRQPVEHQQREQGGRPEKEKERGGGAASRRPAAASSLNDTESDAPLNRRHETAKDRHNKRSSQQQQRRLQHTRATDGVLHDDDEGEDVVMEEKKAERSNAQHRKRKEPESEEADRARRGGQQRQPHIGIEAHTSTRGPVEEVTREENKEDEEEDEAEDMQQALHNTRKRARQTVIVEDDSDSDEPQQSEWTVGRARTLATRPAPSVSLTASYDSHSCAECGLLAKLGCSTRRCNKHCAKMRTRCKAHGRKGNETANSKADGEPNAAATRPRETIDIDDGEVDEDVPLLATTSRERRQRQQDESRQEGREERKEEQNQGDESDERDDEEDEEKGEGRQQSGSGDNGDPSRVQPRVGGEQLTSEKRTLSDSQQTRPQRAQSKGSMDLSSVLRQTMELRKAVAEKQQQQLTEEQKQPVVQTSTQRDYVSQALFESQLHDDSQLDDMLLRSPARVAMLQAAVVPDFSADSKQPPAATESALTHRDSGDVVVETPQTTPHTPPASNRISGSSSAPDPIDTPSAASLASLYLPAVSDGIDIRLHAPPIVVLYAMHIHSGSKLNAQRWLNELPALCVAGHAVTDRPADYACRLCGCAAPWEAAQDAIVRRSTEEGSRQMDKEEVDEALQQLVSDRGKEAVALRRSYLQSIP